MKRMMIILFAIGMTTMSSTSVMAMSKSKVRKEARFLTDKMAYELDLSSNQRNDVYEINYDFIYSAGDLMDYVLRGESWAMDRYYYMLDIRNDDLRWVLSDRQYRRFFDTDYFYRPIYTTGNKWDFRVYLSYTNHGHFFFGKPYHYTSYHCGHHRTSYTTTSYYSGRYSHNVYVNVHSVRDKNVYVNNRRNDFGSVKVRPGTDKPRQSTSTSVTSSRPQTSTSTGSSRINSSSSTSGRTNSTSSRPSSTSTTSTSKNTSGSSTNSSGTSRRTVSSGSSSNSKKDSGSSVRTNSSSRSSSSSSSSGSSRR